jgi:hypothetical protein
VEATRAAIKAADTKARSIFIIIRKKKVNKGAAIHPI